MVAIRSMGLGFESVIGVVADEDEGEDDDNDDNDNDNDNDDGGGRTPRPRCTVSAAHLATLVRVANGRFAENRRRTERFRAALLGQQHERDGDDASRPRAAPRRRRRRLRQGGNPEGVEWEDAGARRERMRAEGLRRREETKRLEVGGAGAKGAGAEEESGAEEAGQEEARVSSLL